uniref:Uncharacterized protein n=1 Tax=Rhipicephalus pulchellus TaxID=72859 RepID=L7LVK5_RHIPC
MCWLFVHGVRLVYSEFFGYHNKGLETTKPKRGKILAIAKQLRTSGTKPEGLAKLGDVTCFSLFFLSFFLSFFCLFSFSIFLNLFCLSVHSPLSLCISLCSAPSLPLSLDLSLFLTSISPYFVLSLPLFHNHSVFLFRSLFSVSFCMFIPLSFYLFLSFVLLFLSPSFLRHFIAIFWVFY